MPVVPFENGFATGLSVLALLLAALSLSLPLSLPLSAAPPEYLANEEIAPDRASDVAAPLDGFARETVAVPPGAFGEATGAYFPILEEILSEATIELAPRTYYLRSSVGGQVREEWAAGGNASMLTGWWRDSLRIGLSGYTSQALATPHGRGSTGLLQPGGKGYWSLGEAYIEGKVGDLLSAKGFRQELTLPFFNRSDSRMTPKSHEAYIATADLSPQLRIGGGHITRMKNRTSEDFLPLSEVAGAEGTNRGATLAGIRYAWPDDAGSIGALYARGWDTMDIFYAETSRHWDLPGDFDFNTSVQFARQSSTGDELVGSFDTQSSGAQAALGFRSAVVTVACTTTDREADLRSPWGGTPLFNSVMISDFNRAGEDSWRAGLSYRFDRIGLSGVSAFANYVHGNTPDHGTAASPDEDEFDITVDLRPEKGVFRDWWLRVRHGWTDGHGGQQRKDLRIVLNCSIAF